MQAYVSAIIDQDTGKFRGAMFRNAPTPSGSDRFVLSTSTNSVFGTVDAAVDAIALAFPDLDRQPIHGCDIPMELPPKGATLVTGTPRSQNDQSFVEIRLAGQEAWKASELTLAQVAALVVRGVLEHDASSGDDPDLAYRYETYVCIKSLQETAS